MMKRIAASLACLCALAGTAHAGNVDWNLGITIGSQPVPVRYEPVYAPTAPPVVIAEPPRFVLPPDLGFRVAVDIPYDLFLVGNRYYLCRDRAWYRAPSYRGPWIAVDRRGLPWELRRHQVATIREYRDRQWRHDCDDARDGREWRKEERRRWKEARRWEREERRHRHERWEGDDD